MLIRSQALLSTHNIHFVYPHFPGEEKMLVPFFPGAISNEYFRLLLLSFYLKSKITVNGYTFRGDNFQIILPRF